VVDYPRHSCEVFRPRNVYSEIHLHITWHTKNSAAVILDGIEARLHQFLRKKSEETPGLLVHAVGGTADHVHLAVPVPPASNVSEWIGRLKGASAHYVNRRVANRKALEWQAGYGVVSFGTKDLPWVVHYVETQRERHARGDTHDRLERTETAVSPLKRG